MDAGHQARLLADAATLGSAHALGVPTTALGGDIRGTLNVDRAVAKGGGFNETARALAKIVDDNAESWLRTIIEAAESCDAIVVAGLAAFAGFSAAEYLSIKSIGSGMIPITQTAAFPSPFLPPKLVPRLLNRASHSFVNDTLWKAFRDTTNIDPKELPDNFLVIGETPHDRLFPRTAAVIHHGGSGTSHSAARAGVPSIVIPFAGDQFFWAERLRLSGRCANCCG